MTIRRTLIQTQIALTVPVLFCDQCNEYFALVRYPRDDNGEPVEKVVEPFNETPYGGKQPLTCPFCGRKAFILTPEAEYPDPIDLLDQDEWADDDNPDYHSRDCTCEDCLQNHPENVVYLDDEDEYDFHTGKDL